jgi:hypothetical protein
MITYEGTNLEKVVSSTIVSSPGIKANGFINKMLDLTRN